MSSYSLKYLIDNWSTPTRETVISPERVFIIIVFVVEDVLERVAVGRRLNVDRVDDVNEAVVALQVAHHHLRSVDIVLLKHRIGSMTSS